jgi:hypothetical protein
MFDENCSLSLFLGEDIVFVVVFVEEAFVGFFRLWGFCRWFALLLFILLSVVLLPPQFLLLLLLSSSLLGKQRKEEGGFGKAPHEQSSLMKFVVSLVVFVKGESTKTFCLGSQNVRDSIPNEHQKKA